MYCRDCERFFDEAAKRREYHREVAEYGCTPYEVYDVCPICGSESIEESDICEVCGDDVREGEHLCSICEENLFGDLKSLQEEYHLDDEQFIEVIEKY